MTPAAAARARKPAARVSPAGLGCRHLTLRRLRRCLKSCQHEDVRGSSGCGPRTSERCPGGPGCLRYQPAGASPGTPQTATRQSAGGPRGARQLGTGRPGRLCSVSAIRPQDLLEGEPSKGCHPSLSSGRFFSPRACTCPRRHRDATPCPGLRPADRATADACPPLGLRAPFGAQQASWDRTPRSWCQSSCHRSPPVPSAQARSARAGPPAVRTAESGGKSPSQQRPGAGPRAGHSGRPHRVLSMLLPDGRSIRDEQKCLMREYCREPGQASWRRPHPSWSQPHLT